LATSSARISVIIVNWNGTSDTVDCLASVASLDSANVALSVIVVDNGSEIDPTAEIKTTYPTAEVTRLDRNVGFAAGCNVGIKQALADGADYILLLNNDAVVDKGLFEALLHAFAADAKIGIVGPLIYEWDGRSIDFGGARIRFALGRFDHIRTKPAATTKIIRPDYVTGTCMLLRRSVIERIGLLDEDLFAYFEDVDLCLRARRAGYALACVPVPCVVHKVSATTRRTLAEGTTSPLKHYLIARNRTVIVRRYATTAERYFYLFVTLPLRSCFYTAAFVIRRRWSKLRWFWRGTLDGLAGKLKMPVELLQ